MSKDDMRSIEVKKDDVSSVIKKLGAPIVVSPIVGYDGFFRYYYVSSLYKRVEPFVDRFVSQYVIVITFDQDGRVVSVYDTTGADVVSCRKTTKSVGKYSFLSQLSESKYAVGGMGASVNIG